MAKQYEQYQNAKLFYAGLKAGENQAFHYLISKIKTPIHQQCREQQMAELGDDILQQTIAILLQKLENGSYQFQENAAPATYAIAIAKNLISNHKRGKRNNALDIESFTNILWTNNDWTGLKETVTYYLSLLGADCQQLIRLRELNEYKYKEIIEQKLMPKYTNEGALRNKFQNCWNKWMEIIEKLGRDQ
jgi:DNA-directed RNA polymerase specialized sigma24 family protein